MSKPKLQNFSTVTSAAVSAFKKVPVYPVMICLSYINIQLFIYAWNTNDWIKDVHEHGYYLTQHTYIYIYFLIQMRDIKITQPMVHCLRAKIVCEIAILHSHNHWPASWGAVRQVGSGLGPHGAVGAMMWGKPSGHDELMLLRRLFVNKECIVNRETVSCKYKYWRKY